MWKLLHARFLFSYILLLFSNLFVVHEVQMCIRDSGTIAPNGRELGLKAGANVVMPNLSPVRVRKKYELYENKICTGEESAQCRTCLEQRVKAAGYHIVTDIGDVRR